MQDIEVFNKDLRNIDEEKQDYLNSGSIPDLSSVQEGQLKVFTLNSVPYLAYKKNGKLWYLKFSDSI